MATKDELEAALNDEFTRRVTLEEQVKNLKAQLSKASDKAYLSGELIDDLERVAAPRSPRVERRGAGGEETMSSKTKAQLEVELRDMTTSRDCWRATADERMTGLSEARDSGKRIAEGCEALRQLCNEQEIQMKDLEARLLDANNRGLSSFADYQRALGKLEAMGSIVEAIEEAELFAAKDFLPSLRAIVKEATS